MGRPNLSGLMNIATSALDLVPPGVLPPGVKQGMEILGKIKGCGATSKAKPDPSPVTKNPNGRHAIVCFIEVDAQLFPILPVIKGKRNSKFSRQALREALEIWEGQLEMDVTYTDTVESANLVITGKKFAAPTPDDVVALTDIGPLFDKKCRLVFDLNESLTEEEFRYTAVHEFGHALGIRHADVSATGALMSPVMDIAITRPTDADLAAAVKKGWTLS